MRKLVVYYSQACGNTKKISEMIQKEKNTDIARIDTVEPYKGSYNDIVAQGQEEVRRNFHPDIKELDILISDYETIFIGTPTWWYTMAPAVATFLSKNDLKGKKVILFQTHGGWPGHTLDDMKTMCKGADIIGEKAIQFDSTGGDKMITSVDEIKMWLSKYE